MMSRCGRTRSDEAKGLDIHRHILNAVYYYTSICWCIYRYTGYATYWYITRYCVYLVNGQTFIQIIIIVILMIAVAVVNAGYMTMMILPACSLCQDFSTQVHQIFNKS